jgi:CxxC motif-containing protein (DUF1111 family)
MRAFSWWAVAGVVSTIPSLGAIEAAKPTGPAFGDPIPGLTAAETARFVAGRDTFEEQETPAQGLGPVFNGTSCVSCHGAPATGGGLAAGGASTTLETRFGSVVNGVFDPLASLGGSLIQTTGIGPQGSCNFVGEKVPASANVVARRRTTSLFGLGLVDAVPDQVFIDLAAAQQSDPDGVRGRVHLVQNLITNTQTVGRFGWKAQVPSLAQFAGDAYVNEMGITNPLFPEENCPQGDCSLLSCDPAPDPEDDGTDIAAFTDFMTMLGAPPRGKITGQVRNGEDVFNAIRCSACHVATLTTGSNNPVAALDDVTFSPYSDFLLHDMGSLGDGIVQGQASGQEMRTAPLWGLQTTQRFLHDGRATTLDAAILAHDGQARPARDRYQALTQGDKNKLLAFLGSL